MKFTRKQKSLIRAHWRHLELQFRKNGEVVGRRGKGYAWGILFTSKQAEELLKDFQKKELL